MTFRIADSLTVVGSVCPSTLLSRHPRRSPIWPKQGMSGRITVYGVSDRYPRFNKLHASGKGTEPYRIGSERDHAERLHEFGGNYARQEY
jgi:hypothetical protein